MKISKYMTVTQEEHNLILDYTEDTTDDRTIRLISRMMMHISRFGEVHFKVRES